MSQNAQNASNSNSTTTSVSPYKSWAFDQYLTYRALGGLMTAENGGIKMMSIDEFCESVGIDRKTTWRWQHQIPNFATLVRQRREEIVPLARETAAWNRLYVIGMTSIPLGFKEVENKKTGAVRMVPYGHKHDDQRAAVDALKTYLGHYSDLKLPTVKQEIELKNNVTDLLMAAQTDGIIEGEVIHAATDSARDGQNPGALPFPS